MKTAVITGGTGAIGQALVAEFSKDYTVYFLYKSNKSAADELEKLYGAMGIRCDITNPDEVRKLPEHVKNCSLLINNAGIAQIKLFTDITDNDWNEMIGTNLSGVFYLTREIAPYMIREKNGVIINISSVWGVYGASCEVHYSAAKSGVIGLTKALSKELGPSGIRVNCIAPGVIDSKMNAHLNADEMQELIDCTPLSRIGTPEDVANAARFFEYNTFTTGQILGVDGGFC